MATCVDDDVAVLEALMKDVTIGENQGWIPIVQEIEGKLYFCHDKTQLPFCESKYIPFPERVCAKLDEQTLTSMLSQAWKHMTMMPLFSSIVMPAPTVALMMTGIPSRRHLDKLERTIEDLNTAYGYLQSNYDGDEKAYYETNEARTIIDATLMTQFKLSAELRIHKVHTPTGWNHLISSCAAYIYYSRIIDLMTASNGFTPSHSTTEWTKMEKKINAATQVMHEEADAALADAIEKSDLSIFISRAKNHPIGFHTFRGVDYSEVRPLIEKHCVSFTYAILAAMERWILTMCDVPEQFHAKLLCTSQPRLGLRNGTLGPDGITFQESLRSLRASSLPSIWTKFTFKEEFFSDKEIDTQHLAHQEYQDATFDALVRLSLTQHSYTVVARQFMGRYFGLPPTQEDVRPRTVLPMVLYDTIEGKNHIKCKKEFKKNKSLD